MKIEYPDNFSLDDLNDAFLWRYIELHKLLDLLVNEHIYFTRLDKFEDGIEGITGKNVSLKAFNQSTPITKENINTSFTETMQSHIIKEDKTRRLEYLNGLSNSQLTQFASCWYLGNRESLAMWKLYSRNDGVAIKFPARELVDTLKAAAESYTNSDFKIFILGPVDYKNIWPFDPHEKFDGKFNALKKDKSYSHESEFRFIAVTNIQTKGKYDSFKLPTGKLIGYKLEIRTNPFMADYQKDILFKFLSKFGLSNCLTHSRMEIRKQ